MIFKVVGKKRTSEDQVRICCKEVQGVNKLNLYLMLNMFAKVCLILSGANNMYGWPQRNSCFTICIHQS